MYESQEEPNINNLKNRHYLRKAKSPNHSNLLVKSKYYELLNLKKQIILYGPPGTGKTYQTKYGAVESIGGDLMKNLSQYKINQRYEVLKGKGQIEFITFHPSYSYEEFVEGITIDVKTSGEATSELKYKLKHGIFKRIIIRAMAKALDLEQSDSELNLASLNEMMEKYRNAIKQIQYFAKKPH